MKKMKLSNKILIVTALTLVIVPLVSMFAISRIYFKVGTYSDRDFVTKQDQAFKEEVVGYTKRKMQAFTHLNLSQLDDLNVVITYIEDAEYGIRYNESINPYLDIVESPNGQVEIKIKPGTKAKQSYFNLKIYAPKLELLRLEKAKSVNLNGNTESLVLEANQIDRLYIHEATLLKNLALKANDINSLYIYQEIWNKLYIETVNTKAVENDFSLSLNKVEDLSINATGEINIRAYNSDNDDTKVQINKLNLITNGIVKVDMSKVTAEQVSGQLSDETQLEIPAKIARLLYKP